MGWFLALIYGNGFEVQKLALVFPIIAIGALLCVRGQVFDFRVMAVLLVGVGYFLIRALRSEVPDIARRDVLLISSAFLSILVGSATMRFSICRSLFMGVLLLGFLMQSWASGIQLFDDMSWSFLRGERSLDKISGTFYSRNSLAGFLEMSVPLFLLFALERRKLSWLWAAPVVVGVVLCFLTEARGGFLAMLGAIGLICGVKFLNALKSQKSAGSSKVVKLALLSAFGVVTAVVLVVLFIRLQDSRGGVDVSIGNFQDRLAMAGIAFGIWEQNPFWGAGGDSFSYLFVKEFEGLPSWYGNALMAHNEYLQVLADYGLVGLLSLGLLVGFGAFFLARALWLNAATLSWPVLGALAVLVAELIRGIVDFNLHVLPNLILFSFVFGAGLALAAPRKVGPTFRRTGAVVTYSSVCVVVLLALFSVRAELRASPKFIRYQSEKFEMGFASEEALRELVIAAPEFKISRLLARSSMARSLQEPEDTELAQVAREDWARVVKLHPRDSEALSNYARMLDENQQFEEAEGFHLEAIRAAVRRELNYGVLYSFGNHLIRRGSQALDARKPEAALGYYLEAQEVLQLSYDMQYRRDLNRVLSAELAARIEFLEGARISPEPPQLRDWRSLID